MKTKIVGIGAYTPNKVIDADFIDLYGNKAKAVSKMLSYHSRYLATDIKTGELLIGNVDMGVIAAQKALEFAQIDANDIDMIIYCTGTPDYLVPPCFTLLQEKLKIKRCQGFDIRSGCAGFGTAVVIANNLICSGMIKKAMIVGADLFSSRFKDFILGNKKMDLRVLFNHMLFGDGAGAVILESVSDDQRGIIYSNMESNRASEPYGSIVEIGGSKYPFPDTHVNVSKWPIFQQANLSECLLPEVLIEALGKMLFDMNITLEEISSYVMPVISPSIQKKVQTAFPLMNMNNIITSVAEGGH